MHSISSSSGNPGGELGGNINFPASTHHDPSVAKSCVIWLTLLKTSRLQNMATLTPHLLSPYLALPPETSLILLTSVLGASTNWLVLRYLHSFLQPIPSSSEVLAAPKEDTKLGRSENEAKVVLVSFLRDWVFWKEGAKKLVSYGVCFEHRIYPIGVLGLVEMDVFEEIRQLTASQGN